MNMQTEGAEYRVRSSGSDAFCLGCRAEAISSEQIRQFIRAADQEVRGADPICSVKGLGPEHGSGIAWRSGKMRLQLLGELCRNSVVVLAYGGFTY